MLFEIGCNLLESFNQIYEKNGEYNPNSIFESTHSSGIPSGLPKDIGDAFSPDSTEGKSNRIKLAKLVYGNGESFTITTKGNVPWEITLNKDGETPVVFDANSQSVTINAKQVAYKKSVAAYITNGLMNHQASSIHKTQQNTFQDSINQLVSSVKNAMAGESMYDNPDDYNTQDTDDQSNSNATYQTEPTKPTRNKTSNGKDEFDWGGGSDDSDLDDKNKKSKLMGYVQRQANTAEKFKNTFAY